MGATIGFAGFGRPGVGVIIGAALGAAIGLALGPRRFHLRIDPDGVAIGRLRGTVRIPWAAVGAFGIEEGWMGRRGRTMGLAVGRRGDEWPLSVPALTYHASGFRVGAQRPEDQLAPYRSTLLELVAPWARARSVPVIEADLDDWWDRHRDLTTPR